MTGSQSLERGIAIIELLDASRRPLGVREIARSLNLSPTIVQRLINTLHAHTYVRRDDETKRYSIGYRVLSLGASLARTDNLIVMAQAELRQIASLHKLNGYLGILRGNRALYLLSIQSEGPVAIRNEPGEVTFLHTTALGKVMLSGLTDEQAATLLGPKPLPKVTEATKTDPADIVADLAEIRRLGYATIFDENIMGVVSVGAPIRDASGQVRAALSVAFARQFEPDLKLDVVVDLVVTAAHRLSAKLGYIQP